MKSEESSKYLVNILQQDLNPFIITSDKVENLKHLNSVKTWDGGKFQFYGAAVATCLEVQTPLLLHATENHVRKSSAPWLWPGGFPGRCQLAGN